MGFSKKLFGIGKTEVENLNMQKGLAPFKQRQLIHDSITDVCHQLESKGLSISEALKVLEESKTSLLDNSRLNTDHFVEATAVPDPKYDLQKDEFIKTRINQLEKQVFELEKKVAEVTVSKEIQLNAKEIAKLSSLANHQQPFE